MAGNVVAADAMMSGGDGQPETLAGVTVTLDGEHAMGETMETGMDGGFLFTGLRAGTYTVTISDFPEDVSFETVSVEVEVEVGGVGSADFTGHFIRTSAVEGQVVIDGEGLAAVTVTLSGGPADESYTTMTDADGMYRFEELRPGDYTVSISDFDTRDYEFAATSQDVSVDRDETGTVSFTGVLLRTSGISGRVSVEGMGLDGVEVTLSGSDTTRTAMTADGGQYTFAGLAAGDYTVSIAVDDAAYVFESMSQDRTVGDDESAIVNFEGAHARTASVSGQLFLDELDKNNMMDAGEHPLAQAGIPVALVGPGVNDQRLSATGADGSFMFSDLQAGSYQLVVPIDATVAAALAAADVAYGGSATGYEITLGVGETRTQAVPFDITHTTVNFSVSLRHGDDEGDDLPGAMVTLSSGESGTTGDDGSVAIKVARAGVEGNTVQASVSHDDYAAGDDMTAVTWDPQMFAVAAENANDIVNLSVEVNVSGMTIETDRGGGQPLAGWAIEVMSGDEAVEGAPGNLGDDGTVSFEATVDADDLPVTYSFAVAEEQDDELDNGEEIAAEAVEHEHDGLSLAGAQDVALEASFATQTLMVYVYHERDQEDGFTGTALGDDEMMSGVLDVEVRQAASGGRTRAISSEDWDAGENTSNKDGVYTFAHLPSELDVIVTANTAGENVIIHGSDQLAAYEDFDDNGIPNTSSVFGAQGGYHHTVELCPMQAEGGDCATFGFIRTYTVDGQAWKNVREMDSDDGFKAKDTQVGHPGVTVSMEPVDGKNLAGEAAEPFTEEGDVKKFDFGRNADGAYSVGVPDGWMATAGMGGDELPEEFLFSGTLTDDEDGHLNIDVTPTTGFLYGIVENQDGVPAEGVIVDVNGVGSDPTDEYGRYVVEGFSKQKSPAAAVVVTVSGAGYAMATFSSAATGSRKVPGFKANSPVEYNIDVTGSGSAATFTGTVTAAGGGGLAGVQIKVDGSSLLNPNAKSKGSKVDDIYKTEADGAYTVMVEANGADVTLSASMDGMSFQPGEYTQQARAGSFPGPNFTGFEYATISGRVTVDGKPQPYVKVEAKGAVTKSDVTNNSGIFSISVPYGSYTITAVSEGYSYTYPGGATQALTVNLRPGETYPFAIKAAINEGGRPPRITTTSFSYEENTGSKIGDLKAVDDDDSKAEFTWSGANNDLHVNSDGALRWVTVPSHDDKNAANNKKTLEVTVTSSGTNVGSGDNETTGEVTVTVTPSDNVVVALKLNPASISEAGGTSTVTAELEDPASSEFYVTVSVTKEGDEVRLSSNKTLTIRKGDKTSSGPPVTITAINDDNAYEPGAKSDGYKRKVAVSGAMSPRIDNMEVKSASLLIEDDDLAYGKVVLVLEDASIDESGDDNSTTVTAKVVGGVTFSEAVTVLIEATAGATVAATNTIVIPANARVPVEGTSDEVTITAADDDDVINTVVTVSGTATVPDANTGDTETDDADTPVDETATDPVPEASRPADVYLTVDDDDVAASAPRDLNAARSTTTASNVNPTYTVTWKAPSNPGTVDGTETSATSLTYQYRFERTEVIGDATWSAATSTNVLTAEIDLSTLTGVNGDDETGATPVPGNWRNRSFTVQVRVNDNGTVVATKEFTTPAAGS